MVVEKIISVNVARENVLWVVFAGGFVSLISTIFTIFLFPSSMGIFISFLITITASPFMHDMIRYAVGKSESLWEKRVGIMEKYREIIVIYMAFFSGIILVTSALFEILPEEISGKVFYEQISEIQKIRGMATLPSTFLLIIKNNLGVLALSFLFCFLFGAGATFILSWNALVLSAAIGMSAKSLGGIISLPTAVLHYFPHGSLEILAYFITAIAGGILSHAIIKRRTKRFWIVAEDCAILVLNAIFLLFAAALIETLIIVS